MSKVFAGICLALFLAMVNVSGFIVACTPYLANHG